MRHSYSSPIKRGSIAACVLLGVVVSFQNCSPVNFESGAQSSVVEQTSDNDRIADPIIDPVANPGPALQFPEVGSVASAAFEDSYPNAGDADYNDFIMNFKVTEEINARNEVTAIEILFMPRAKYSSADHRLSLVMDGRVDNSKNAQKVTTPLFVGGADVRVDLISSQGQLVDSKAYSGGEKDLILFPSTNALFNGSGVPQVTARVQITLKEPGKNSLAGRAKVDISRYRIMLRNLNSGYDIDLVEIDEKGIDPNGYPFAMIVPTDWRFPKESVGITGVYPVFADYRVWLLKRSANPGLALPAAVADWYNQLASGAESKVSAPR